MTSAHALTTTSTRPTSSIKQVQPDLHPPQAVSFRDALARSSSESRTDTKRLNVPSARSGDGPKAKTSGHVLANMIHEYESDDSMNWREVLWKKSGRPGHAPAPEQVAGQAIDIGTRGKLETAFGADFTDVRLHTNAAAGVTAQGLRAAAFTRGNHITFAPGRYAPNSDAGKYLLAHELAHVLQQRQRGPKASAAVLEYQAGQAAQEVVAGRAARTPLSAAPDTAQHSPEDQEPDTVSASKPALKYKVPVERLPFIRNIPFKNRYADITVKVAVSPAGAGKDPNVPTQLIPKMQIEVADKLTLKLTSDVLKFQPWEWQDRLWGLGFRSKLENSWFEGEVASNGIASLGVVNVTFKAWSTDLTRFSGSDVALEVKGQVSPEHLLRGKERALLQQFRKNLIETQKVAKRIENTGDRLIKADSALKRAEKELAETRAQVKRLGQRYKGRRPRGIEKAMLRELKTQVLRLERSAAQRSQYVKALRTSIKKDGRLLRRLTARGGKIAAGSTKRVFRLLTNAMAKKAAQQMARVIPILFALGLAYDVIVLLRNLALGRLSWGLGGEGDPWGNEVGKSTARPEGRPTAVDAGSEGSTENSTEAPQGAEAAGLVAAGVPSSRQEAGRVPKTSAASEVTTDGGTERSVTAKETVDGGVVSSPADDDVEISASDGGLGPETSRNGPAAGETTNASESPPSPEVTSGTPDAGPAASKPPTTDAIGNGHKGGNRKTDHDGGRKPGSKNQTGTRKTHKSRKKTDRKTSSPKHDWTEVSGYNGEKPDQEFMLSGKFKYTGERHTFPVIVVQAPEEAVKESKVGDQGPIYKRMVVKNKTKWKYTVDNIDYDMYEGALITLFLDLRKMKSVQ
ncbi:eCIS core domain-containing protein [Arthrobacter oryzae]|uniref:eCIS core domain-containing protein n=1 Tax=Arthrobacter oryzae TaxID=409290 RepID=UPI00277F67CA|nr:DUF4157 domain-containing protein [Arthrobacter oryzae]MDQ0079514.1 hypothetical protein [Arthrobacter oryzae]